MHPAILANQVLFSKEIQAYPKARILYFFTGESVYDTPEVIRLACGKRLFDAAEIGMSYTVETRSYRLCALTEEGGFEIYPDEFTRLMRYKAAVSKEKWELRRMKRKRLPLYNPDTHYTFEEQKKIVAFRAPWWREWLILALRSVLSFLAVALPLGIFLLLTERGFVSSLQSDNPGWIAGQMTMYMFALPFLVFVISLLLGGAERLLFVWPLTRGALLKQHVLLHGGEHKAMSLAREHMLRMIVLGAGSILFLVIGCVLGPVLATFLR